MIRACGCCDQNHEEPHRSFMYTPCMPGEYTKVHKSPELSLIPKKTWDQNAKTEEIIDLFGRYSCVTSAFKRRSAALRTRSIDRGKGFQGCFVSSF